MSAKRADRTAAREAAYRGPTNPFDHGSRRHRYFAKARQHVDNMDAAFRDLEAVYGTIGQRKEMRDA
ncbi:hypothetical protein [Bradyrhizobium lupini]|uniref:hypothetical protein n=1 Tax=Rhizobium lupini TaxID=136996 RepID=UPI0034C68A33